MFVSLLIVLGQVIWLAMRLVEYVARGIFALFNWVFR